MTYQIEFLFPEDLKYWIHFVIGKTLNVFVCFLSTWLVVKFSFVLKEGLF